MKSEWFKLSDEEQERFYEEHNIGGGFRETMGSTRKVKDSELPPDILKVVRDERKKMLDSGEITKEEYDKLCNS